jgi:Zn-dependent M28 family amino/carboxypeptidase
VSLALVLAGVNANLHGADPEPLAKRLEPIRDRLVKEGLVKGQAYAMLTDLCTNVGHRLSGSPAADKAVSWAERTMTKAGLDRVRLEPVMVPHWVRGEIETASYQSSFTPRLNTRLSICALGGSIGTPPGGITAEVLEVRSFEELRAVGERAKGKIIFFNRPFDAGLFDTFSAYGGAVGQRGSGAVEAARAGGVAALVRSMTGRLDDVPHTGSMGYAGDVPKVPAAAVSTVGANRLSQALKADPKLSLTLVLSCETLPDAPSSNVLGELVGAEKPGEVIVIGGHLDSWDKGQGAHDDGAGCVHAIEALRLLKALGIRPKRTIRAVMFMNEENGNRGGGAYAAAARPGETAIAAIESDRGGGMPHGFSVGGGPAVLAAVSKWAPIFEPLDLDRFRAGGGGVDIGPLMAKGVPGFEIIVDTQRYFDYHHSDNDVLSEVNERELELGAIALALFSYTLAEEGLPTPNRP